MAITPDAETNFFLSLSDFWTKYFLDTKQLKTIYDSAQLLIGQQYLDLLSDVLAVSLKDTPLFSKRYFHYFPVREDLVSFVEGRSTSEDRWLVSSTENLARASVIMNRVVSPTSLLENGRDYTLDSGTIAFKADPFNVFDSPLPGFAVRTLQILYDAAFAIESVLDWKSLGVAAGDTVRIYPTNKQPQEFLVRLVGAQLGLQFKNNTKIPDVRASGYRYVVLRTPYDTNKKNVELGQTSLTHSDLTHLAVVLPNTWQVRRTSGTDFTTLDLAGKYLWVADTATPSNQGLYRIRRVLDAHTLEIDKPTPFETTTSQFGIRVYDYKYAPEVAPSKPITQFDHSHLIEKTLKINAVRAVTHSTSYPAGGPVVENVDYTVDYELGALTWLVPADPDVLIHADYSWNLLVTSGIAPRAVTWRPGTLYNQDTAVVNPTGQYVLAVDTHFSGSSYYSDSAHWRTYSNPLINDAVLDTREIGGWIPNAEIDDERLYSNFGFLLGVKKPSSENYRALLEGLSQLFLLGPTFEYVESALNAMAGFPLVRDDNERILSVDTGVVSSGTSARLTDVQFGYNGTLATDGTFTVENGNFQADDALNSSIRINRSQYNDYDFVIETVTSSNAVTLNPHPGVAETDTGFYWTHTHANARRLFETTEYSFSVSDIGGYIAIVDAVHQRNLGVFRINDFVNEHCLVLETEFEFYDEDSVSWQFTRTNEQRVTTDQRTYKLPFAIPLKTLTVGQTVNSFDALTEVFSVVDYVVSPTWWYGQVIPDKLLQLENEDAGRRHATPGLIRHETNPVDNARIGDPGLIIGADDEGREVTVRSAVARWLGANTLHFNQPSVYNDDVGQYLQIVRTPANIWLPNHAYAVGDRVCYSNVDYICKIATTGSSFDAAKWDVYPISSFVGSFRISAIGTNGISATLEDFPTASMVLVDPGATGLVLQAEDVHLPPRLYRRTVGFVIMDRFLKYHTMKVKINSYSALDPDLVSTISSTLRDAKPCYAYLFVNPLAEFRESVVLSDSFSVEVSDV